MNGNHQVQAISKGVALAYVNRLEKLIDYEEKLADGFITKARRRTLVARAKRLGGLR